MRTSLPLKTVWAQPVEQSHSHLPRVLLGFASRNPEEAHALIDQEGRKAVHQRPSGRNRTDE